MYDESTADKFIVLQIADYLLGLPISDVLKVVNYPSHLDKGFGAMGLVQLGRHTIRVLDLHQQLSVGNLPQLPSNQPFLVITRNSHGELCGIIVNEPPDLVELSPEMLRILPKSDYQSSTQQLFSHTATLIYKEATKTIFLLDVKQLFQAASIQN